MTTTQTLTLDSLQRAALSAGYPAVIVHTGGNVVALSMACAGGAHALVALDDGMRHGSTWVVALDGATRESVGDVESHSLPVTSDAEQTIGDAVRWVEHVVHGDALADGDGFPPGHWSGCGCDLPDGDRAEDPYGHDDDVVEFIRRHAE